ncbi:hypothetical protein N7G274_004869 [Stereocaulon virgatum]|uniref:Opioid growth factor receptor (OGFr) conserved domain-containing protein n=1 Tax=Stereocaulon virgatum TaxID=373712 RepID=A0ABR4ACF0_9LECA
MSSYKGEQPFLVRFYDSNIQAKDTKGRTLTQILSWNDDQLEYHHDYIQLLFPLPEGSPFNLSAPIIDRATFNAFRTRDDLQSQLRLSLICMLHFYGFSFFHDQDHNTGFDPSLRSNQVVRSHRFDRASRNWVKKFNHNHLRITRILRSLRVLGLEEEAKGFFKALQGVFEEGKISDKSMMFWTRAVERPLYLAPPEDDDDEGDGADFLYEYENDKKAATNGNLRGGEGALEDGLKGKKAPKEDV